MLVSMLAYMLAEHVDTEQARLEQFVRGYMYRLNFRLLCIIITFRV